MKLLHIIAGAETGGAETFCFDAIKALHARGVEQFVVCRPHQNFIDVLEECGIPHRFLSFHSFKSFFEQRIIHEVVKDFQPDLVHCWMRRAGSYAPSAKHVDAPVLGWFGGPYDLKYYKNCQYYMGVTRDIVRHIKENIDDPEAAYLGHTFGTLDEDTPVSKSDFDIPENAKVVLLLSRMHWKKGVDTLLAAAQSIDHAYFLLAGDGPDIEKYKKMAQDLGVADRVRFPGWRNDRAALLAIADVCTLPSRYEPFGTVIAESWHAKVPLVATKADGAKQYVSHEEDGLLCEIDDVRGLTTELLRALDDDVLRKKIIKGGTKTYNQLFSKDVVIETLLASYQDMINKFSATQEAA